MKISKIWMTIALSLICAFLLFAGCSKENGVESIAVKGYSSETPLEITVGGFSYESHTLIVTYEDGTVEEVPLMEEYIPETDKLKFYQEGNQQITISYEGVTSNFSVNVSRNVFPDDVQLRSVTKTYTGESFTVEVEGNIPNGTKIIYPQGNTFVNAGLYDITAVLQCENYISKTLSARVVVDKADYDVSNALLYDQEFVYDNERHGVYIKGAPTVDETGKESYASASLPDGVTVSYTITKIKEGNGAPVAERQTVDGNYATDAGTYEVRAKYKGNTANFNPIPDSVAQLVIHRAEYDMSDVSFEDQTYTYTGGIHSVSVDSDYKLPASVTISYEIKKVKNGSGEVVDDRYIVGNSATEAGVYQVRVTFKVTGKTAANYMATPSEKYAYLTIEQADFSQQMQGVYVDYQWYEYEEGKEYRIPLGKELPQGVTPVFVLKDAEGTLIEGTLKTERIEHTDSNGVSYYETIYVYVFTVSAPGTYSCEVSFTHTDENYQEIDSIEAQVMIEIPEE